MPQVPENMKYYPLLLFLCLSFTASTQNNNIFFIENIPEKGFILEKNWKRQFGDDPNWRNPAYDDSNWESFNPVLDINKLKENEKGVAWLRTKLVLSPNIQNTPLTLTINQLAASEIYVNGFLIKKIGKIEPNNTKIEAVSPSLTQIASLPYLTKDSVLTIAVKIAYEENYFRDKIGFNTNYYFKSTLMKTENAGEINWHGRKQLYYAWIQFGIFFILTIIHLLFYYNDKKQKANFYFVGTTLFMLMAFLCMAISFGFDGTLADFYKLQLLETIGFVCAYSFLLKAIYEVYRQKTGLIFWGIICVNLLFTLSQFTNYSVGSLLIEMTAEVLVTVEIIRIALLAKRENKAGAQFLAVGMTISLLLFIFFYFDYILEFFGMTRLMRSQYNLYAYQVALIGVPIYISMFLALHFSKINKKLIEKLNENARLNAIMLTQEQEKKQILESQKEILERQVQERTIQLEDSLKELKNTQNQLIQNEKLASLGELTAGIAHEIQNPLNFVNNFSELSVELSEELKENIENEPINKELVKEILADLVQNQQKINHHGKRASNIVRNMLEHSRKSTGNKELTDVNALIKEYLPLSYHGMRAKYKLFMADYQMNLAEDLVRTHLIPQDIGRVLLNMFNNAFYAVQKAAPAPDEGANTGLVMVTTYFEAPPSGAGGTDNIIISIKDNGVGIPDAIKSKIYQPFFTTKPTGEGTGLGLSLSYDIITKGHNGTIEMTSTEGVGTEFKIKLPIC